MDVVYFETVTVICAEWGKKTEKLRKQDIKMISVILVVIVGVVYCSKLTLICTLV